MTVVGATMPYERQGARAPSQRTAAANRRTSAAVCSGRPAEFAASRSTAWTWAYQLLEPPESGYLPVVALARAALEEMAGDAAPGG